jgi:xanthine/CO dehydrogenase XdhC/CoxF family maturation factor
MRDTHQLPLERTTQIFWEAAIVRKAIERHRRTATYRGETEEAYEMGALCGGVSKLVLALTRSHQQSNAA